MDKSKLKLVRYVPVLAGGLFVLATMAALIGLMLDFLDKPPQTKKMVQQISLIQPPPPPPLPKVEEPPPEPELEQKVEQEPEPDPEPAPDSADLPAGDSLGLDADGGAGGDAFGLLGLKGKRDLIGARGGARSWYANVIKSDIQEFLYDQSTIRKKRYAVDVRLWIDSEGLVQRFELLKSSGDRETDSALKTALASYQKVQEKPPEDVPHSFTVRITSRI